MFEVVDFALMVGVFDLEEDEDENEGYSLAFRLK